MLERGWCLRTDLDPCDLILRTRERLDYDDLRVVDVAPLEVCEVPLAVPDIDRSELLRQRRFAIPRPKFVGRRVRRRPLAFGVGEGTRRIRYHEWHEFAEPLTRNHAEVRPQEDDLRQEVGLPADVHVHPLTLVVELWRQRVADHLCLLDLGFGVGIDRNALDDDAAHTFRHGWHLGFGLNHRRDRRGFLGRVVVADCAADDSDCDCGYANHGAALHVRLPPLVKCQKPMFPAYDTTTIHER